MYEVPVIKEAGYGEAELLAEVLTDAFSEDPVMNWIIPMPALYPEFFRLLIRDIFAPRGIIDLEQEQRGVGLWLPPGEKFDVSPSLGMMRLLLRLFLRKGPRPLIRIPEQDRLFHRHHPHEPHYHLVYLGCRRQAQGQGVGSALLKQGTRICDEQAMPAYLESSNKLNVPLYQRHGFEIIAVEPLPRNGPNVWFMWREPQ